MEESNKPSKIKWSTVGWIIVVVIFGGSFLYDRVFQKLLSNSSPTVAHQESVNRTTDYFRPSEEWKNFVSPNSHFKVLLPKYPEQSSEPLDVPDSDIKIPANYYSADTDDYSYLIAVFEYPPEAVSNPQANLDGSLNGMLASNSSNEIISTKSIDFLSEPAIDFIIFNRDEGVYMKGISVLKDTTLYSLIYSSKQLNSNEPDYNKFIKSFSFVD